MIATLILIGFWFGDIGIHAAKKGEDRCGEKYGTGNAFIAYILMAFLYYHAGLFDKFF